MVLEETYMGANGGIIADADLSFIKHVSTLISA